MQYYIPSTNRTVQVLPDYATPSNCRDYGLWPIYDGSFTDDPRYWTREKGAVEYLEQNSEYVQYWVAVPLPLELIKASKREDFAEALSKVDTKSVRGDRGAVLAIYEAYDSPETPVPQKTLEDIGILWELEEVAQYNRDLLKQILVMEIPAEATQEEAEAIAIQAINIVPWLPWETSSPPASAPDTPLEGEAPTPPTEPVRFTVE